MQQNLLQMLLPLISACKWEPPDQLNKFEESNCFLSEMNWCSGASIFIWTTSYIYRDKTWEEKTGSSTVVFAAAGYNNTPS